MVLMTFNKWVFRSSWARFSTFWTQHTDRIDIIKMCTVQCVRCVINTVAFMMAIYTVANIQKPMECILSSTSIFSFSCVHKLNFIRSLNEYVKEKLKKWEGAITNNSSFCFRYAFNGNGNVYKCNVIKSHNVKLDC